MSEKAIDNRVGTAEGNGEADGAHSVPESGQSHPAEPREITVYDAIAVLWSGRRTLAFFIGGMLVVAAIFLLGSRAEYRSRAILMPEKVTDQGIGDLGVLNQFSGLLGAAIPPGLLGGSSTQIPPDLYPEIARSTGVQLSLLRKQVFVPAENRRMSLYQYLTSHKPFSLWESIGRLPASILLQSDEEVLAEPGGIDTTIIHLTRDQEAIVEELRDRVRAEFDIPQGVVKIAVSMPDPEVSAQVADAFVNELTDYVSAYRSDRQRRKTEFIQALHDDSRSRFNTALRELANFRDSNRNLARDLARTEEQRLQAEYELTFGLYNSLSSRLEEAKIQLQEQTPVFKVLQPVTVPLRKSYPPTLITLLLCGLLGSLIGGGYLFFKPALSRIRDVFRN